jgi:Cys-tRNA(Pro)/Cys-tRNA(Cys) deacylase
VDFALHTYAYDPDADRVGLQAAEALGVPPARMLKTLMALVDGRPVCAVIPSHREVSMKALAAVFSGKSARMMAPADAERLTGYRVGGISPFGQKRTAPTVVETAALAEATVFVNGGQRGLQIEAAPTDLARAMSATIASIVAGD